MSANWDDIQTLRTFCDYWDERGACPNWRAAMIAILPADISYTMRGRARQIRTKVMVRSDQVNLIDEGWLNAEDHYCEFKSPWQDFAFEDGRLTVSGRGPKIGEYTVTITPTGERDSFLLS